MSEPSEDEAIAKKRLQALREIGVTDDHWGALFQANDIAAQKILTLWPSLTAKPGIAYDAQQVGKLMGMSTSCALAKPTVHTEEIIVWNEGWTLNEIQTSRTGKVWMVKHPYHEKGRADPGYYRLIIRMPGSNSKTREEQTDLLTNMPKGWVKAHPVIVLTTLMIHHEATGENLIGTDLICCDDPNKIAYYQGFFQLRNYRNVRHTRTWMAIAKKCD